MCIFWNWIASTRPIKGNDEIVQIIFDCANKAMNNTTYTSDRALLERAPVVYGLYGRVSASPYNRLGGLMTVLV